MATKSNKRSTSRPYLNLFEFFAKEKVFLSIVFFGAIVAAFGVQYGQVAMWIGFAFAAYATVANDSIQSLGTFIESNRQRPWWLLWLFVGVIFLVTVTFSFIYFDGDVTYQRLAPDDDGIYAYPHPENFNFFQIIAPLVLLVLTRLKMPVSTTFLMLSVFSATSSGITSMIFKSVSGYGLAFVVSFVIWFGGYNLIKKYFKQRQAHGGWTVAQWIISGALWSVWLMQDGANIAVFLPRQLSVVQFVIFTSTIFLGLGLLFYLRGDKIQEIVSEKIGISDVRAATLIDFSYVLLLIYKLFISPIPMSTTWVFLGVIGGRELAINLARKKRGRVHKLKSLKMIGRDFGYAFTGLVISIVMASFANPAIREQIVIFFQGIF